MALEKSVLTHDVIRSIVHNHYGLEMSACRRLPIGSANCYRVDTEERSYFLKEFQSAVTSESVIREAALTEYLSKNGFRAALFMKNLFIPEISLSSFIKSYTKNTPAIQHIVSATVAALGPVSEEFLYSPQLERPHGGCVHPGS